MQSRLIPRVVLFSPVLVLVASGEGEAATRVTGNMVMEKIFASGEFASPEVLTTGVNVEIVPATRKFRTRFVLPFQFTLVEGKMDVQAFPVGNFGVDINTDTAALNLQYGRFATVSSTAQLTEVTNSRVGLSLYPRDLPRLNASFSRSEVSDSGTTSTVDSMTLLSNYRYKWLEVRGGTSLSERESSGAVIKSSSVVFGARGDYVILPRTTISGEYDFDRFVSDTTLGETESVRNTVRASVNSRPVHMLELGGEYLRTVTSSESRRDDVQQSTEINARLRLPGKLQISPSVENNSFNDQGKKRNVTSYTLAASYSERLIPKVLLGLNASRSYDRDPDQGNDTRDSFGINAVMDLFPRVAVRVNLVANKQKNSSFVVQKGYDASGTLEGRDAYDDRPAGFTFFDLVNNDLYTKNSAAIGDWSAPVRIQPPVTGHYSFIKNLQVNLIPTDKTNFVLAYTANSSSERFDFAKGGNQTLTASMTYLPKKRSSLSVFANATMPQQGVDSYSATVSMSHTLYRGPQVNLSYTWHSLNSAGNAFTTGFNMPLPKRAAMSITYSASNFLREDQSYVLRVGLNKTF